MVLGITKNLRRHLDRGTLQNAESILSASAFLILLVVPMLFDLKSVYPYEYVQGIAFQIGVEFLLGVVVVLSARGKLFIHPIPRTVAGIVITFVIWSGISTLLADSPTVAFWGSSLRHQGYLLLLHHVLFFGIMVFTVSAANFKKILLAVPVAAAMVSIMGLLELLDGGARITSTFGHPNFFASVLAMTLPISLYYFLAKPTRMFMGVSLCLQFLALLLTYSRASWVAAATAVLAVIIAWIFTCVSLHPRRLPIGALLSLIGFIAIITISIFVAQKLAVHAADDYRWFSGDELKNNPLSDRFKNIVNFNTGSGAVRTYIWKDAIDVLRANFLFGVGSDNLGRVYPLYYRREPDRPAFAAEMIADRAHNEFLDTGIAYGLPGLLLWIGIIAIIGWSGKRVLRRANQQSVKHPPDALFTTAALSSLGAYFFSNQFGFAVTTTSMLFWIIAAAVVRQSVHEDGKAQTLIIHSRAAGATTVIFLARIVLRGNIFPLIASHRAAVDFRQPLTSETEQHLKQAIRLAPHEQHYYFLLATIYYSAALNTAGLEREDMLEQSTTELERASALGLDPLTFATSLATTYQEWTKTDPSKRALYDEAISRARAAAPNFFIK